MDLFIVTMITYGRLSLSGVVGDHPGETIIRKGRSMNIQLMNVAVDIIEQRLGPPGEGLAGQRSDAQQPHYGDAR